MVYSDLVERKEGGLCGGGNQESPPGELSLVTILSCGALGGPSMSGQGHHLSRRPATLGAVPRRRQTPASVGPLLGRRGTNPRGFTMLPVTLEGWLVLFALIIAAFGVALLLSK